MLATMATTSCVFRTIRELSRVQQQQQQQRIRWMQYQYVFTSATSRRIRRGGAGPTTRRSFGIFSESWAAFDHRPSNSLTSERASGALVETSKPFSTDTAKFQQQTHHVSHDSGITNDSRAQNHILHHLEGVSSPASQPLQERQVKPNSSSSSRHNTTAFSRRKRPPQVPSSFHNIATNDPQYSHFKMLPAAIPAVRQGSSFLFPLRAIHLGQTIDLTAVLNNIFETVQQEGGRQKQFGKNSLVIELPRGRSNIPLSSSTSTTTTSTTTTPLPLPHPLPPEPPKYIAVFRFGSVVSLNMDPPEFQYYLNHIRKYVTDPIPIGSERREDFGVLLQPHGLYAPNVGSGTHLATTTTTTTHSQHSPSPTPPPPAAGGLPIHQHPATMHHPQLSQPSHPSQHHLVQQHHLANSAASGANDPQETIAKTIDPVVTAEYCVVSDLDLDGVAVISNIMAQTVALDTYNDTADDLLNRFAAINSTVRASGKFYASDKSFLFKSVAQNNAIFIDMISKIRLKDRSDTAWKITRYENVHYGLKNEFEIDDRFDQIEYKLNLIQQNSKFFLEVLNSEKTNSLEWTIVWLIGLECCLMCIDMSGWGPDVFFYLGKFVPSSLVLTSSLSGGQAVADVATALTTTATPSVPPVV